MMMDTSILEARIQNKIMNACLESIVAETFLGAIPVHDDDLTIGLAQGFRKYAIESMKDLGSHKLLDVALENNQLSTAQHAYLLQVKNICMETATTVTARILEENKDDFDMLSNAADKATLTDSEMQKFSMGAAKVVPEKLTEMIQKKVLDTVVAEKEAYKKDAELETEITDALKATDDEPDTGIEDPDAPKETAEESYAAYIETIAGRDARSNHTSMFARIQELCMESLMFTTESYFEMPFETLTALTKKETFSAFESSLNHDTFAKLDNLCMYGGALEGEAPQITPVLQQNALFASTMIYTFFETLSTMNLFKPDPQALRNFVDEYLPIAERVENDRSSFVERFDELIGNVKAQILKGGTTNEMCMFMTNISSIKERCNGVQALRHDIAHINERLDEMSTLAKTRHDQMVADTAPKVAAIESAFDTMRRCRDIEKFSRLTSTMIRKPDVSLVKFKIDPDASDFARKYIAVECYTPAGNITGTATIALEKAIESSGLIDYVTAAIDASTIKNAHRAVMLMNPHSGKIYKQADPATQHSHDF